jgi:predicted secreted protein
MDKQKRFGLVGLIGAIFLCAAAQCFSQKLPESTAYNLVDLQAEVQREVPNDLLQAVLFVEANEADPAHLASELNSALADALAIAKKSASVTARSGGYQTYPLYDRSQKLTAWRGRAEVRLESRDLESAATLIARLQARMQLGSIIFSVSPESRNSAVDTLTAEAIAAFRSRSDIARQALGAKAYKIRRIALNTQSAFPQPRPFQRAAGAIAADAIPVPGLEGGTSRVSVAASGTIEVE